MCGYLIGFMMIYSQKEEEEEDWFHDLGRRAWKRDESHFLFLTAVTLAASPTDFAASLLLVEFRWFFRSSREGGWEFITNFLLDS